MKLLKRNDQGTHKFQHDIKEFLLSELREDIQLQEHFVNWNAAVLDEIKTDVTFVRRDQENVSKAPDDIVFYYEATYDGRKYHLAIDELDPDEMYVRAIKADEDGQFDFSDLPDTGCQRH